MEGCYHILKSPNSCHVITFLSTTILLLFIQPSLASTTTTTTTTPQSANKSFIKTSCASTTYPSLCSKTLLPYAPTVQSNPVKLCNAALSATLNSARATSALVSTLARQRGITSKDAAVIKDCISNIGDSVDELKQSVKAMDGLGTSPDKRFQTDNIKTWLSAAITDEYTCTDGFSGLKVSADVKSQIRKAISEFTKLTSNALSLVNHLNY